VSQSRFDFIGDFAGYIRIIGHYQAAIEFRPSHKPAKGIWLLVIG
jgi:hypothetical protein